MKIAVARETVAHEARVAASPETVKKLIALGAEIVVESGAGLGASLSDEAFTAAGARVEDDAWQADIIFKKGDAERSDFADYGYSHGVPMGGELEYADHVTLEIDCGKGTYVRALVRELGVGDRQRLEIARQGKMVEFNWVEDRGVPGQRPTEKPETRQKFRVGFRTYRKDCSVKQSVLGILVCGNGHVYTLLP